MLSNFILRFVVPVRITSDQGTQFTSLIFKELSKLLGIDNIVTTAYHPQSNDLVERFHCQLKTSLLARGNIINCSEELPFLLLGLCSVVEEDIKSSPAEMVYGQCLRLPGEMIVKSSEKFDTTVFLNKIRNHFANFRSNISHHTKLNKPFIPKHLEAYQYVFVRQDSNKCGLCSPYLGSFEVLDKNQKYFKHQINNKPKNVSIDRIKPAFVEENKKYSDKKVDQSRLT